MTSPRASSTVRIILLALATLAIFGLGLISGLFLGVPESRFMPEVFGAVGPAVVPVLVDPAIAPEGALHVGEIPGSGVWKRIRVERPLANGSELCLSIRWEAESVLSAWVWIRLGEHADRVARVEIQRSSIEGAIYSHGRGLTGTVKVNRITLPTETGEPLLVELALSDYDGGSEGNVGATVELRAEEFR